MRLTYYANACCLMEVDGFRILTDPWLVDGAFEGSWCHYPPLKVKPQELAGVDALFVSHVHPDHCCPETLSHFPRDIPVLVLGGPRSENEQETLGLLADGLEAGCAGCLMGRRVTQSPDPEGLVRQLVQIAHPIFSLNAVEECQPR